MKIIVGIGNPGKKYAETRHNIGFRVVAELAGRHRLTSWRKRFHSRTAEGMIGNEKVLLMMPETYVNESGLAVRAAMAGCRVRPQEMMMVCDDFNLPLGRLRIRSRGRSGGQHGLDSIFAHLGTDHVPRLRLGIGSEGTALDRDFVLSTFAPEERPTVEQAVERAARALEVWLEKGLASCQNEFNRSPNTPAKTRKKEADA